MRIVALIFISIAHTKCVAPCVDRQRNPIQANYKLQIHTPRNSPVTKYHYGITIAHHRWIIRHHRHTSIIEKCDLMSNAPQSGEVKKWKTGGLQVPQWRVHHHHQMQTCAKVTKENPPITPSSMSATVRQD